MPVNKNALIRYLTLDKCLSNKYRKYTIDDLLQEVNNALKEFAGTTVSKRQLYEDLKFMESSQGYSAPITKVREGKKVFYKYENPDFSIKNTLLNEDDVATLKVTLKVLSKFSGLPYYEKIEQLVEKLQEQLKVRADNRPVINFDLNIDLQGIDFLPKLFYAVVHKQVLFVEYETFDKERYELIFHPQYLKQYNRRWFVIGVAEDSKREIWLLALDRIKKIKFISRKYILKNIDWEEDYFYDIIGVTRFAEIPVQEVQLLFSPEVAQYVITKPLHPSQINNLKDDGSLLVKINVIPNYELESIILSFGEAVEVLNPPELREKIKTRLIETLKRYK